jgi:AcrR family transcriptional regulator
MQSKSEQIVEAAIALLAREGLGVPTARIAREAGVANGTLFNTFPTKQDLIDRIYVALKQEVGRLFAASAGDSLDAMDAFLRHVWRAYILWAMANPERHKVMLLLKGGNVVSPAARAEAEAGMRTLTGTVDKLSGDGWFGPVDGELLLKLAEAEMAAIVEFIHERGLPEDEIEKLIAWSYRAFCTGIDARPNPG